MDQRKIDYLTVMGIQRWACRDEPLIDSASQPLSPVSEKRLIDYSVDEEKLAPLKVAQTIETVSEAPPIVSSLKQKTEFRFQNYDWQSLARCLLDGSVCESCHQSGALLGEGDLSADWLFVSDAPSAEDVQQQTLFTGQAGKLFDAMLYATGLNRKTVYISTIFKCPPSDDSNMVMAHCSGILQQQIALLKPKVIVTLGEFAAQSVLKSNDDLTQLRSARQCRHRSNVLVVPTYHPNGLLEQPALKVQVWNDLKLCLSLI